MMTSPGGWFGGFLNDTTGGSPSTSSGSSASTRAPRAPSVNTSAGSGSADSRERSTSQGRYSTPQEASAYGQVLYSSLDLPPEWGGQVFTAGAEQTPYSDYYGNPVTGTELVQMTVAAGLEWLRNLSVTDKEAYNAWVVKLYDAGYLEEKEMRFNRYTSTVAQAFAEAAHDTANINLSDGEGRLTTLGDQLQGLADGAAAMGDGADAPPVRIDTKLDDETLKSSLKDTARSLLGRALSDDEEAQLVGRFRSVESAWNENTYNARVNGGTVTDRPDADVIGEAGIDDTLGTERTAQQLGGYAGVLMNMVGLGHSTSIGGTLGNGSGQ